MPFRFWLWPLPTSVVISGGPSASPRLVSLVLRPNHRSNTGHARTRLCHRTIHYVHPYLFVFASAPIPKFRCSMSPQCVSILRGLDRLPDLETKSLAVSCRQTHRAAPCSPTPYERFGFVRACGCSPGFSVASSFRRRSRPLPRRPMTSAAFPIRRTFHRRVLLPQCFAFRLTPPRASSRLRGHPPEELARFQRRPSPAHPTAVSPAAFAFAVTVIPHDGDCWSRSPFTHASKPELLARASLDPAVTGFLAALLRGAGFALRLL